MPTKTFYFSEILPFSILAHLMPSPVVQHMLRRFDAYFNPCFSAEIYLLLVTGGALSLGSSMLGNINIK